jgi:glucose-1-phosphate thymidylyltransferase
MAVTSSVNVCEVIGVLPAGGRATRVSPLPCSKEILPAGLRVTEDGRGVRPKAVSHYLLEKMHLAGIRKVYIVLREGKWDIPSYYNDGTALLDMDFAYLMMRLPYGPPFTVNQAYAFVRHAIIAFGFPDVLFEPRDAFVRLLERQAATGADVVLGACPTQPADMPTDRLDIDPDGHVRRIAVNSQTSDLQLTWVMAVWTPVFTEFMHACLATVLAGAQLSDSFAREMIMGDVIALALESGLHVDTVQFLDAKYLDLGTPEGLARIYGQGPCPTSDWRWH